MIATLVTAASIVLSAQTKVRPAAYVLDARGRVELRPSQALPTVAKVGQFVYPGERLAVPADGAIRVSILAAGVTESIKPGTEVTVGPKGCSPAAAVLKRERRPHCVAAAFKNLRPSDDDVRRAGVSLRSGHEDPKAVTPICGATVASDRPGLAWPPVKGTTTYRVKLLSSAGRELWKAGTTSPAVDFPRDKPPLQRGYLFRWEVTDQDFRPVATGDFIVATESECSQMEELKGLAASRDQADRLEAAMGYRLLGALQEATAVYEGLVHEFPDQPAYRQPLDDLYHLSGRSIDPGRPDRQ